jgi:hypothetical protein
MVVVVRDDITLWMPPYDFLWTALARNGAFELGSLPPGNYFALVEPLGRNRWDSEYLRVARLRGVAFRSDGNSPVTLALRCR